MNSLRFILFCLVMISAELLAAQEVQAYLNRRWLQEGEELRIILTIRGMLPTSAPEFPEMEGFSLEMREISARKEGALRTTVYEQVYVAEAPGTRVVPPLVVPFQDETMRISPGVVTVHPASQQSLTGYQPTNLTASLSWSLEDSLRLRGQIQQATLWLTVPENQINNLHWDLGALAELADSIRRSPAGKWILADSMIQSQDAPLKDRLAGNVRFPLYRVWMGCAEPSWQLLPSTQLRIERRWARKSVYRGARNVPPRWEDEFLSLADTGWSVKANLPTLPAPAAACGPLEMDVKWSEARIGTGEPLNLDLKLTGPVYMGMVPAPALRLPSTVVLRGPEVRSFYEDTGKGLMGVKVFSYSLYPAEPGRFALSPAILRWIDPSRMQPDSTLARLPVMEVTGPSIPQLLDQNQVEQFYASRIQGGATRPLSSRQWVLPLAIGLLIVSLGWFVFVLKTHLDLQKRMRRQQLKSKRFPGP